MDDSSADDWLWLWDWEFPIPVLQIFCLADRESKELARSLCDVHEESGPDMLSPLCAPHLFWEQLRATLSLKTQKNSVKQMYKWSKTDCNKVV